MKSRVYVLILALCIIFCGSAYADDSDVAYLMGEVDKGMYTNRALGAEAYFGSKWRILSQEEIAQVTGTVYSKLPTLQEISNGITPAFMAQTHDNKAHINIIIQNLDIADTAILSNPDSKEFNNALDAIGKYMKQNYVKLGFKDIKTKRLKTKFLETRRGGIYLTAKANGSNFYVRSIVCIKGDYCFSVNVSCIGKDVTDNLLGMFSKIKY